MNTADLLTLVTALQGIDGIDSISTYGTKDTLLVTVADEHFSTVARIAFRLPCYVATQSRTDAARS
jgi:hypothetical protein